MGVRNNFCLTIYMCRILTHIFLPSKYCSAASHPHQSKCEYYEEMAPFPHPLSLPSLAFCDSYFNLLKEVCESRACEWWRNENDRKGVSVTRKRAEMNKREWKSAQTANGWRADTEGAMLGEEMDRERRRLVIQNDTKMRTSAKEEQAYSGWEIVSDWEIWHTEQQRDEMTDTRSKPASETHKLTELHKQMLLGNRGVLLETE